MTINRKLGYSILADSNLDWGQNQNYLIDYLKKNPDVRYTSKKNKPLKDKNKIPLSNQIFDPESPTPGLVVITANQLVGIIGKSNRYQWIKENLQPVDHVAYSYLVFNITPQDLFDKR